MNRLLGRFLKDGINVIAKSVPDLYIICWNEWILLPWNKFPGAFKLAKVKFFSKKVDLFPHCPNFRMKFFSYKIFFKYQSGVKSNNSADLFLLFLNDKILKVFDNGLHTSIILTDLQNGIWFHKSQNSAW